MPHRAIHLLAPFLAAVLATGCFGVDVNPSASGPTGPEPPGSPGPEPPGPLPVGDALRVQRVLPAADATGVPVDAPIEVTFTRPVDPTTIDDRTFRVIRRPGVEDALLSGSYTLDDENRIVTFAPSGGLANNTVYAIELTDEIQPADAAADPFTGARTSFSTSRVVAQHADPEDDTFERIPANVLLPPDLVGVTVQQEAAGLTVTLTFADAVDPRSDRFNSVGAFVDLDVDQDRRTGGEGAVERFGRGGPGPDLGVEYIVELHLDGTATVVEAENGDDDSDDQGGGGTSIAVRFAGRVVEFTVPYASIGGDDGNVNTAVVVGTRIEATDIAPDRGFLKVGNGSSGGGRGGIAPANAESQAGRVTGPHAVQW